MRLQNKNIIITGGASGIGLASVERCLAEGANVVMADLESSKGKERAGELQEKYPGYCLFIPVDVSSTDSVDHLIDKTVAEFGSVDSVFNNAGIGGVCPAVDYTDEDFNHIIDVNLTGVFRVARAAMRQMYKQNSGNLVNCASILGMVGQSGTAPYSASKGAVVNMTRTLALEGAEHNVRVNGIGPAYIKTPLLDLLDEDMLQGLISLHPLKRLGTPEEVANAYVFLASDEASFITGTTLMVDGGFTAGKS